MSFWMKMKFFLWKKSVTGWTTLREVVHFLSRVPASMQTCCTFLAQGSRRRVKISQIWISTSYVCQQRFQVNATFQKLLKLFLSRQRFSSKLLKCIITRLWKQTMIQLVTLRVKVLIKMVTRRVLSMWCSHYLQERWTLISLGNRAAALLNSSCTQNSDTLIFLSNVKKPTHLSSSLFCH